jgi:ABC-type bacteriocin/lantibiotic exporter with double-glycine peptidase domain
MGAYFVTHGNFTLGGMSLFQGILGSMINSVGNCISAADQLQTMRTGIERLNDINRRETRQSIPLDDGHDEKVNKLRGSVSAKDICYRYNSGDRLALDHVSIEAAPGQMIAIVGSTGCGKSTLLRILADLYKAESGEILYDGRRREEIPDVIFHSSVSTVDQEAVMFEDSIYNNIKMWDSTIENYEVVLAARDAQIHERVIREKKDYGAMIEENGRNFSGGELQRFELARALAHEPTLLLLDEFTSALDALTEEKAMNAIREKGTTCVIVAHRLSTIIDCDRIYVMDKGRIVQEGTHSELSGQEGLYKELVS